MDNLITGILAIVVFVAFVAGLVESIGAVPSIIIVAIVAGMMLFDLWRSVKEGSRQDINYAAG